MRMRFAPLVFFVVLAAAMTLAACGGAASAGGTGGNAPAGGTAGGQTLTVGASSFVGPTTFSIQAGQSITLVDPSASGGFHNIVTGTDGEFAAEAGAPAQIAGSAGVNIQPGSTVVLTFAHAGTYQITCTIHPPMQATVTVG